MERLRQKLARAKTFTGWERKRPPRSPIPPPATTESQSSETQYKYHLSKVPQPSGDLYATLKRSEKDNLQRDKVQKITGIRNKHRQSLSHDDITLRRSGNNNNYQPPESPLTIKQRTKTMFAFFERKSPKPTKKMSQTDTNTSSSSKSTSMLAKESNHGNNNKFDSYSPSNKLDSCPSNKLDSCPSNTFDSCPSNTFDSGNKLMDGGGPSNSSSNDIIETVVVESASRGRAKSVVPEVMQSSRKRTEFRTVEIDIEKAVEIRRTIGGKESSWMSRSLGDVKSVKAMAKQFERVPIMGRTSIIQKKDISVSPLALTAKRRSSLPADLTEMVKLTLQRAGGGMANQNITYTNNNLKNSQLDLSRKSPTSKSQNDNQDTLTKPSSKKKIKTILQKFLSKRPSQAELVKKGILQDQKVYGNSLRNLTSNMNACERKVPEFVAVCFELVEEPKNVISHGIYRASGNIATIQKIRVRINERNSLDILREYRKEVDVLTGSLKLFFRELTEPLISLEMFTELVALKEKNLTNNDRLHDEAELILNRQPACHRDVLHALINHIMYVISHGDENSMSVESMAIVWGPSLIFTDTEDSFQLLQRITNNNSILKFLLDIYEKNRNGANQPARKFVPALKPSESSISLTGTLEKTSSKKLKKQQSMEDKCPISPDLIANLIQCIEKSDAAKREDIYNKSKRKKVKKIFDKLKTGKSIEKYTNSYEDICDLAEVLKTLLLKNQIIPNEIYANYDGSTLTTKQITAHLDDLQSDKLVILEMTLNHLNNIILLNNSETSFKQRLIKTWAEVLFSNCTTTIYDSHLAESYLDQLLSYRIKQKETEEAIQENWERTRVDFAERILRKGSIVSEHSLLDRKSEIGHKITDIVRKTSEIVGQTSRINNEEKSSESRYRASDLGYRTTDMGPIMKKHSNFVAQKTVKHDQEITVCSEEETVYENPIYGTTLLEDIMSDDRLNTGRMILEDEQIELRKNKSPLYSGRSSGEIRNNRHS